MRLCEFYTYNLRPFLVRLRLANGYVARTIVFADSYTSAKNIAVSISGNGSVISVTENAVKSVPTVQQAQIKSLNDQARHYREMAKTAKATKSLQSAKKSYQDATAPKQSS